MQQQAEGQENEVDDIQAEGKAVVDDVDNDVIVDEVEKKATPEEKAIVEKKYNMIIHGPMAVIISAPHQTESLTALAKNSSRMVEL